MKKQHNTKTLVVVYIILVVFMVMVGVMGIVGLLRAKDNPDDFTRILYSNIIAFGVAIIGSIVIVIYMSSYIEKKLDGIMKLSERMSNFDLTKDIEPTGDDAFGKALMSVNEAQFRLREVIEKLQSDSENTEESSRDIADAVRKAQERLELINVSIMDYQNKIKEKPEKDKEDKEILIKIRELGAEIGATSQFLEQVVIAADYQQEVSENYVTQLKRFKL
jgi:hypothetical protein